MGCSQGFFWIKPRSDLCPFRSGAWHWHRSLALESLLSFFKLKLLNKISFTKNMRAQSVEMWKQSSQESWSPPHFWKSFTKSLREVPPAKNALATSSLTLRLPVLAFCFVILRIACSAALAVTFLIFFGVTETFAFFSFSCGWMDQ